MIELEHAFDYYALLKPPVWIGAGPFGPRMFAEVRGGEEPLRKALASGEETRFEDQYIRTTPMFETGDERYRWLTQSAFIARGRAYPGGVAYEVFRAR